MNRSVYSVRKVTVDKVFIVDENTGMLSVTNDAEHVCAELFEKFGPKHFLYRDTDGRWDELIHTAGIFDSFRPGEAP
jgi:hypothetical protein